MVDTVSPFVAIGARIVRTISVMHDGHNGYREPVNDPDVLGTYNATRGTGTRHSPNSATSPQALSLDP